MKPYKPRRRVRRPRRHRTKKTVRTTRSPQKCADDTSPPSSPSPPSWVPAPDPPSPVPATAPVTASTTVCYGWFYALWHQMLLIAWLVGPVMLGVIVPVLVPLGIALVNLCLASRTSASASRESLRVWTSSNASRFIYLIDCCNKSHTYPRRTGWTVGDYLEEHCNRTHRRCGDFYLDLGGKVLDLDRTLSSYRDDEHFYLRLRFRMRGGILKKRHGDPHLMNPPYHTNPTNTIDLTLSDDDIELISRDGEESHTAPVAGPSRVPRPYSFGSASGDSPSAGTLRHPTKTTVNQPSSSKRAKVDISTTSGEAAPSVSTSGCSSNIIVIDSSSEDESTSSSSSTRPVAHRLSPVAGPLLDKGKGKARQENEIDASRGQDMEVDDHYDVDEDSGATPAPDFFDELYPNDDDFEDEEEDEDEDDGTDGTSSSSADRQQVKEELLEHRRRVMRDLGKEMWEQRKELRVMAQDGAYMPDTYKLVALLNLHNAQHDQAPVQFECPAMTFLLSPEGEQHVKFLIAGFAQGPMLNLTDPEWSTVLSVTGEDEEVQRKGVRASGEKGKGKSNEGRSKKEQGRDKDGRYVSCLYLRVHTQPLIDAIAFSNSFSTAYPSNLDREHAFCLDIEDRTKHLSPVERAKVQIALSYVGKSGRGDGETRDLEDAQGAATSSYKAYSHMARTRGKKVAFYTVILPSHLNTSTTKPTRQSERAHPVLNDLEKIFIASMGELNSDLGGDEPSWTPSPALKASLDLVTDASVLKALELVRRKDPTTLAAIKQQHLGTPGADPSSSSSSSSDSASDSDSSSVVPSPPVPAASTGLPAAELEIRLKDLRSWVKRHFTDQRSYIGSPITDTPFNEVVKYTSAIRLTPHGVVRDLHSFSDNTKELFDGESTFYGPHPGPGILGEILARVAANGLDPRALDRSAADNGSMDQITADFGAFVDLFPLSLDHTDIEENALYLLRALLKLDSPVVVSNSSKMARIFTSDIVPKLFRKGISDDDWEQFFDECDSSVMAKILDPDYKMPSKWEKLKFPDYLRRLCGKLMIVPVGLALDAFRLLIYQLHFGIAKYDPRLERFVFHLRTLIELKARVAFQLAEELRPATTEPSLIPFRAVVESVCDTLGVNASITEVLDGGCALSEVLNGLRASGAEARRLEAAAMTVSKKDKITMERARLSVEEALRKEKAKKPKAVRTRKNHILALGEAGSLVRQAQANDLIASFKEEKRRGRDPISTVPAPRSMPVGSERWLVWILKVHEKRDLVYSAGASGPGWLANAAQRLANSKRSLTREAAKRLARGAIDDTGTHVPLSIIEKLANADTIRTITTTFWEYRCLACGVGGFCNANLSHVCGSKPKASIAKSDDLLVRPLYFAHHVDGADNITDDTPLPPHHRSISASDVLRAHRSILESVYKAPTSLDIPDGLGRIIYKVLVDNKGVVQLDKNGEEVPVGRNGTSTEGVDWQVHNAMDVLWRSKGGKAGEAVEFGGTSGLWDFSSKNDANTWGMLDRLRDILDTFDDAKELFEEYQQSPNLAKFKVLQGYGFETRYCIGDTCSTPSFSRSDRPRPPQHTQRCKVARTHANSLLLHSYRNFFSLPPNCLTAFLVKTWNFPGSTPKKKPRTSNGTTSSEQLSKSYKGSLLLTKAGKVETRPFRRAMWKHNWWGAAPV